MNAVTKPESIDAAVVEYGASVLEVISRAARDPSVDIDKMERLIAMQERIEAKQAKASFTAAKLALRPALPEITMRGHIVIRDKIDPNKIIQDTPFARFEDIHSAIVPVLTEHGFDLSFKNGLSPDGKVRVTTVLDHKDGHSEETYFDLPHDSSGSKNAVQAVGSSTSYAKRYGVLSLLNIKVVGEDDDATEGGKDPPTVRVKLDGPYTSPTALKRAVHEADREIRACGDPDMLDAYLRTSDFKELVAQLENDAPEYLHGGDKLPPEYEPLKPLVQRMRKDLEDLATANHMTDLMRT